MNYPNIMFGYMPPPPPMEKLEKSEKVKQLILIDPFLLKEYNLFSQNTESSLEQ